ncbi:MAG: FtsX-like permease family protein [Thermoanaerobaculales bacterium]|jgi:putative ABC transport system permease protein|nr:FtsX-like permease family protein [Thermoanaerobaculales bacterium]
MRFLPFVLRNLKRKKTRTILTIGSIAVALFLFGLLVAIENGLNAGVDVAGADRLVVRNRISLIQPLPLAYQERLRQIPHVAEATHATWFGGIYQDERNFFPQFVIDTETYREVFSEFAIPDDQWRAFLADREGAVVGRASAERFGWEIGDRIPLRGTIFQGSWELNIRAIYQGANGEADETQLWFHYDYLDESRRWGKGLVGWYTVKVDDPDHAVEVAAAIDERFSNSAWETSTETEKAFAAGFAKQIGNIRLIVLSIGAVVLFTLLLVTGSAMSTAVRERVPELGVLKTLGFGDGAVLGLVLVESVLIALVGGALGIGLAKLFTMGGDPTGGMLASFHIGPDSMALGLVLALAVGVLAGLIPAITAMRLRIVDALRRV